MPKLSALIAFLFLALCSTSAAAQGVEMAKISTAAKLMPPGKYTCQVGSYKARDCEIVAKGSGVELVIPAGLGHFIELRAELLPSDDKNQLTLLGQPTSAHNICDTCEPGSADTDACAGGYEAAQACLAQPLTARLKVSKNQAKGTLLYYIMRPSYEQGVYKGSFKLGNTVELTIKKK